MKIDVEKSGRGRLTGVEEELEPPSPTAGAPPRTVEVALALAYA